MIYKLVATLLLSLSLTGCFSKGAESFAEDVYKNLNSRNFELVWDRLLPSEQEKVRIQLEILRKNELLARQTFGFSKEALKTMTAKDYFIAILNSDKSGGSIELVSVEEFDTHATVKWVNKGMNKTGESKLIKQDGKWYLKLD